MADTNVIELVPQSAGDDYRGSIDTILAEAGAESFDLLAVIGTTADGEIYISGNCNAAHLVFLIERAKLAMLTAE